MDSPKISIITVLLNNASTLERTLKSIYSQIYHNIEHIVIDGGSTDGSLDIVMKYRNNMDYFISEPDSGIYNAMNKGIKAATGDILFFLNSDDYFTNSNIIEEVVNVFTRNTEIEIVFGNQVYDHGNKLSIKKQSFESAKREQLARTTIQHQTVFARKHVFDLTNGFSKNYKIVSDYEWILKVFLVNKCRYYYLDRNICAMSVGGTSWVKPFEKERIEVMKEYFSFYEIIRYRVIPWNYHIFKYKKLPQKAPNLLFMYRKLYHRAQKVKQFKNSLFKH